MTRPTNRVVVDEAYQLGYDELSAIAKGCGGWLRSSSKTEGDSAEAWFEDTEYVFKGRGLTDFLYAVKDAHVQSLYAAVDLCDYIEKSAKQPPSVFVRDAILARARELKAQIQGTDEASASTRKR